MTTESNQTNQAVNLLSVESLINSTMSRFEILDKEYKEQKSMIDALLENDLEYQEAAIEAKKQAKLKTIAKQKVMTKPEATHIVEKLQDTQSQIKELKTALSDYLAQYVTLSGSNQIEGADGVLRQIIYTAKLVKSK